MPTSPPRPCSRCGQPVAPGGKCLKHHSQADRQRGTSQQRGYDHEHRDHFRKPVLERDDYVCQECGGEATNADHYPRTRRDWSDWALARMTRSTADRFAIHVTHGTSQAPLGWVNRHIWLPKPPKPPNRGHLLVVLSLPCPISDVFT